MAMRYFSKGVKDPLFKSLGFWDFKNFFPYSQMAQWVSKKISQEDWKHKVRIKHNGIYLTPFIKQYHFLKVDSTINVKLLTDMDTMKYSFTEPIFSQV